MFTQEWTADIRDKERCEMYRSFKVMFEADKYLSGRPLRLSYSSWSLRGRSVDPRLMTWTDRHVTSSSHVHNPHYSHCFRWCFTSTESIRLIRDGEPRTATSPFAQLLGSTTADCVSTLLIAFIFYFLYSAIPCHLLKSNWKPSSSHSISILTNISTQFLLQSMCVCVCVCVCVCL